MKPLKRQLMMMLSLGLMMYTTGKAHPADQDITTRSDQKPVEMGTYVGLNRTVNLLLVVNQANGVTLRVKNEDDITLHEFYMKKSTKVYHYKLNFADSQSGISKLEISDGRKTIIRRVEVVDVPAIESQRYITFTSPSTL